MMVLKILGAIVLLIALYAIFTEMNNYSYRRYKYEFFSMAHLLQIIIGYWIIYFGNTLYLDALKHSGDVLNGELLMGIGVIVVAIVLYENFQAVPLSVALIFSAFELALCAPLAVAVLFIVIIAVAALAETKPVYVLNND